MKRAFVLTGFIFLFSISGAMENTRLLKPQAPSVFPKYSLSQSTKPFDTQVHWESGLRLGVFSEPDKLDNLDKADNLDKFDNIRVRIFPLLSTPHMDPYPISKNKTDVKLISESEIHLNFENQMLASGQKIHFDLSRAKVFVYKTLKSEPKSILLQDMNVFSKTPVTVLWNEGQFKNGKSIQVKLPYRGVFQIRKTNYKQVLGIDGEHRDWRKATTGEFKNETLWSLINVVSMQDYLKSVVPSEVYVSWPKETLKAQAVAARTYAAREMIASRGRNQTWDVDPTTWYQSYRGRKLEKPTTSIAVQDTVGEFLTYNEEIIEAYFSANSGGVTCTPRECFNDVERDVPYLKSFSDVKEIIKAPGGTWKAFTNPTLIRGKLKEWGYGEGLPVIGVSPFEVGDSGRLWRFQVHIQDGDPIILDKRNSRRIIKGYRGRLMKIDPLKNGGTQNVVGHGFGHGVGMSQWGAKILAEKPYGWNFRQILKFYYKGASLKRF